jgi:hypothetical protein
VRIKRLVITCPDGAVVTTFLAVADGAFGTFEDLQRGTYGENGLKAVGVNMTDSGIQAAIGLTLPGRLALIGNAINQGFGMVQTGALRWYSEQFAANNTLRSLMAADVAGLETAYRKMDLTNITKALSVAVYDAYAETFKPVFAQSQEAIHGLVQLQQNPSLDTLAHVTDSFSHTVAANPINLAALISPAAPLVMTEGGRAGLLNTLTTTGRVLDGLVDSTFIARTSWRDVVINSQIQVAEALPLSDGLKAAIINSSMAETALMHSSRDWATSLVDF